MGLVDLDRAFLQRLQVLSTLAKAKRCPFQQPKKAKNVNAIMPEHFTWHKKLQRASQHRREITRAHTHAHTHFLAWEPNPETILPNSRCQSAERNPVCAGVRGAWGAHTGTPESGPLWLVLKLAVKWTPFCKTQKLCFVGLRWKPLKDCLAVWLRPIN